MLNADGLLPAGRVRVTVEEFHGAFVEPFPESKTRERLFDRWQDHRAALASMLPLTAQWIDGSFVTAKVDPGDIDLVNVLDGVQLDAVPENRRAIARMMLSGQSTRNLWGIDSYPLPEYPDGHPFHNEYLRFRGYWDRWFGLVRGNDQATKGYLEVIA
jgi:hypothetical protein